MSTSTPPAAPRQAGRPGCAGRAHQRVAEVFGRCGVLDWRYVRCRGEVTRGDAKERSTAEPSPVRALHIGQLGIVLLFVDEGTIDADAKPIISRALRRQTQWAHAAEGWAHAGKYIGNLEALQRILEKA